MRVSLDTNVLVYSADADAGEKKTAQELIRRAAAADCVLTLQALAEFYNVASRRRGPAISNPVGFVAYLRGLFRVQASDEDALVTAMDASQRHRLPFWDAMLWATASAAGCQVVFSEDFQDGRRLGSVTFINPFDPRNAAAVDRALPPPPSENRE